MAKRKTKRKTRRKKKVVTTRLSNKQSVQTNVYIHTPSEQKKKRRKRRKPTIQQPSILSLANYIPAKRHYFEPNYAYNSMAGLQKVEQSIANQYNNLEKKLEQMSSLDRTSLQPTIVVQPPPPPPPKETRVGQVKGSMGTRVGQVKGSRGVRVRPMRMSKRKPRLNIGDSVNNSIASSFESRYSDTNASNNNDYSISSGIGGDDISDIGRYSVGTNVGGVGAQYAIDENSIGSILNDEDDGGSDDRASVIDASPSPPPEQVTQPQPPPPPQSPSQSPSTSSVRDISASFLSASSSTSPITSTLKPPPPKQQGFIRGSPSTPNLRLSLAQPQQVLQRNISNLLETIRPSRESYAQGRASPSAIRAQAKDDVKDNVFEPRGTQTSDPRKNVRFANETSFQVTSLTTPKKSPLQKVKSKVKSAMSRGKNKRNKVGVSMSSSRIPIATRSWEARPIRNKKAPKKLGNYGA